MTNCVLVEEVTLVALETRFNDFAQHKASKIKPSLLASVKDLTASSTAKKNWHRLSIYIYSTGDLGISMKLLNPL